MKKTLIFALALVLIISCALLVACQNNVVDVKFKKDTVPTTVILGDTVDYSKIKLVVTMENGGKEKEISLTDNGVSYTEIDVTTIGYTTLVASYRGKSAQAVINVEEGDIDDYVVTGFENSLGYTAYIEAKKEKDDKDTEFVDRDAPYIVGNTNGYRYLPHTTSVFVSGSVPVVNTKVKTTYKLSLKNGATYTELTGTELAKYVSKVDNNIYYFTEEAVDKMFKLEVTLSDEHETTIDASKRTVEQEFKVIEGYNVYNARGMSVMDNLNNKSWASIKQTKLAWDDGKALSEFTNVSKVIIHNNITVTKNDLPANYFWTENENASNSGSISYQVAQGRAPEQLRHLLKGSLKEICLGEDWENGKDSRQRGLYMSDGISLYGNYLTLSYDKGYVEDESSGNVTAPNGGIYVVNDYTQKDNNEKIYSEAHWNLIAYRNNTDEPSTKSGSIENVYFVGQSKKTENTNIPCGIGMVFSELEMLTVKNVIGNQWYFNLHINEDNASLKLDGGKFFDSFSQMVFGYYAKKIDITNSTLKRAGGPLIIVQSPRYKNGSSGAFESDRVNPADFKIDSTNNLENWLTGSEVWFQINTSGAETIIEQLFGMNALLGGTPVNGNYSKTIKIDGSDTPQYNLLMIHIPHPSDVFDSDKHLSGSLTIGDQVYTTDDPVLNIRDTAQQLADLVDELKVAFGEDLQDAHIAALDQLKAGALGLKNNKDLLPLTVAPLYKSGNNYAYNDTTKLLVVPDVVKGLVQLSGGAQQAVGILQSKLNDVNNGIADTEARGGDASGLKATKAAIEAIKAKWEAWIAAVKPMTDLAAGISAADIVSTDDEVKATVTNKILTNWAQAWASNSEDYVALWVNPGGLSTPPNLTYQYFMLVFGANTETTTPAA